MSVILEALASYQRRGLCEMGLFVPVQVGSVSGQAGDETQAYQPPPQDADSKDR